ncbi:MAG: carbohydrate kinase family protein [Cyclobacteriaceae bacterium]
MKILSFGEILFDIIEGEHYLGGAPLNFTAHAARLGVQAYILSRLGQDDLGQEAMQKISSLKVNTSLVQWDEQHPTGTVPVSFEKGQPSYIITENVAYDFISYDKSASQIESTTFDVLYFGTLAQRNAQSADALAKLVSRNTFREIFYDINLRKDCYNADMIRNSLKYCTIFKLNDEEVNVLAEMFYNQPMEIEAFTKKITSDFQIGLIVITAGAKGCYVYQNSELHFVKGYPAKVVDTVGAGDAFSAAFLIFFLQQGNALRAADKANRLGAFVASSRGPQPVYTEEIRNQLAIS